jgi:hypothetical protein
MANLVDEAAPQFKLPDHEKHHFEIDEAGNQPYASPLLSHIYIYIWFLFRKSCFVKYCYTIFFHRQILKLKMLAL